MRLDPLCDAVWRYDLMRSVGASPGADEQVYGQGDGTLTGRLSGQARWSNYPRLREGYAFPEARGVIEVVGCGFVLFTLSGMSSLADGSGVHVMMFRTDDPAYRWLNTTIAVGEGSIDVAQGMLVMRYYACAVDYLPDLEKNAPTA